LKDIVIISV